MNLDYAKHMVNACRSIGYVAVLLAPFGVPDAHFDCCVAAVLIRGVVEDEVSMELVASVAATHNAMMAGDDHCIPDGVDGRIVDGGFILI